MRYYIVLILPKLLLEHFCAPAFKGLHHPLAKCRLPRPHSPPVLSFIPFMISADLRVTVSSLTLDLSAATGIATPVPYPDLTP